MGGAESVVRNVDKRASRREHRLNFEAAVARFREAPFEAPAPPKSSSHNDSGFRVCIRKRPFFQHEAEQGEFDVLTCLPERIVVHDARMHADMVNMFMNHHDFSFDEVFGEEVDNDIVYQDTACQLVDSVACGGQATIMMYGQTGSGKTFTMSALQKNVAEDLFHRLPEHSAPESTQPPTVSMYFIELLGDSCFDMLNGGAPCNLVGAVDGSVHPHPSVEVDVQDANEMLALIRMACKLRATAATGVHDQSSRSHAICRIFIRGGGAGEGDEEGCLTLVDLAGTEHRIDNAEHNAERQREGAKINASLAALKDCIRASAARSKFVNFRQNRLTQLLRGCFVHTRAHPTIVIATVSPSSKDTEHSLNTLRHAIIMDGQGEGKGKESKGKGKQASSHLTGGIVRKEMLGEIDVTGIARARAAARRRAPQQAEPEVARNAPAHQSKQSNTMRRAGLDRRCVESLPPDLATRLLEARAAAAVRGTNQQRARLQGRDSTDGSIPLDGPSCDWHGQQWDNSKKQEPLKSCSEFVDNQVEAELEILKTQEEFIRALNVDPYQQHADCGQEPPIKKRHGEDDLLECPARQQQAECDLIGRCNDLDNPLGNELLQTRPVEVDMGDFACPTDDASLRASRELSGRLQQAPQRQQHRLRHSDPMADEVAVARAAAAPAATAMAAAAQQPAAVQQPAAARQPAEVEQAAALPGDPAVESAVQTENEKAMALFRLFCSKGRGGAQTWRKNDLRLINTCVVPAVFGPGVQIDWAHPNAALDDLERLIAQSPSLQGGFQTSPRQVTSPRQGSKAGANPPAALRRSMTQQAATQGTTTSGQGFRQSNASSKQLQEMNALQSSLPEGSHKKMGQDDQDNHHRRRFSDSNVVVSPEQRFHKDANSLGLQQDRPRRFSTDSSMANLEQRHSEDQHDRAMRRSGDGKIANLEQQVASAEASARRWLAELRQGQITCP